MAYPKLRRILGLPPRPTRVYDVVQQMAIVDEDVLDRFGVDTIELGRGFAQSEADWVPWTLPDGTDCLVPAWTHIERQERRWVIRASNGTILAHMPDGALYFEQTYFPMAGADGPKTVREALDQTMWTAIASPSQGRETTAGENRQSHHRLVRRQSLRDRPVLPSQRSVHDDAGRRARESPRVSR